MIEPPIDLAHFDLFDQSEAMHDYSVYAYAREHCPVVHTGADGGYHLVTRYEDVTRVLEDHETFSSRYGASPRRMGTIHLPPVDADPPVHREYRMLLNKFFSPRTLERYVPEMHRIARETIDQWIDDGQVELVHRFAAPFAAGILARVILNQTGSVEERHTRDLVVRSIATGTAAAYAELADFCRTLLDARAAAGDHHDDIIGAVLRGTVEGQPLTEEDRVGVLVVVCLGSLETSPTAMSNIVIRIAADPQLEQRVREPAWVETDFEEFLRLDSPAAYAARTCVRDTVLNGFSLGPGDVVVVANGSANRDPEVFEHPDQLDFERPPRHHVAFGAGVHRCIGANFARIQLRVGFEELFARITNLRMVHDTKVTYHYGMSRSPAELHVRFDRI